MRASLETARFLFLIMLYIKPKYRQYFSSDLWCISTWNSVYLVYLLSCAMPNLGWVVGEIKNHLYGKRQKGNEFLPRDQVFPFLSFTACSLFYTKISRFTRDLSIRFLYLLIFYFEKFSTWIWRLLFVVKVTLNLSIISSTLRRDLSPGTLDCPSPQTQHFQYQIWCGKHGHFQRSGGELPCVLRAKKNTFKSFVSKKQRTKIKEGRHV